MKKELLFVVIAAAALVLAVLAERAGCGSGSGSGEHATQRPVKQVSLPTLRRAEPDHAERESEPEPEPEPEWSGDPMAAPLTEQARRDFERGFRKLKARGVLRSSEVIVDEPGSKVVNVYVRSGFYRADFEVLEVLAAGMFRYYRAPTMLCFVDSRKRKTVAVFSKAGRQLRRNPSKWNMAERLICSAATSD